MVRDKRYRPCSLSTIASKGITIEFPRSSVSSFSWARSPLFWYVFRKFHFSIKKKKRRETPTTFVICVSSVFARHDSFKIAWIYEGKKKKNSQRYLTHTRVNKNVKRYNRMLVSLPKDYLVVSWENHGHSFFFCNRVHRAAAADSICKVILLAVLRARYYFYFGKRARARAHSRLIGWKVRSRGCLKNSAGIFTKGTRKTFFIKFWEVPRADIEILVYGLHTYIHRKVNPAAFLKNISPKLRSVLGRKKCGFIKFHCFSWMNSIWYYWNDIFRCVWLILALFSECYFTTG